VQLEQDFEIASNEFENINVALKQDLPRFMMLTTRFINPLFHSFFYMQYVRLYHFIITVPDDVFEYRLNIYYMILDKINQFSEGKYTVDVPASQIAAEYEEKRGDAAAVIEALSITQRFISTCE
jgi:amphiphysin